MGAGVLLHTPLRPASPGLLDDMFRLRSEVFRDRLNWDIPARNRMDRDCFDLAGAVYGISVGPSVRENVALGCWRLLPMSGPTLIEQVFPDLVVPEDCRGSASVWEVSRFATGLDRISAAGKQPAEVVRTLLAALFEVALDFGVTRIVAVSDARFVRILTRYGIHVDVLSSRLEDGRVVAVSGVLDVHEGVLSALAPAGERRAA